ncbi:quinone oxidoreductase [Pseudomonas putida]|uniref:Quinone oxidoreductase n=1 Tax=Pseudomonas putida TaxID=303 RepID=A0AA37VN73_PSEPU|nr:quinone oxidoreductase [Pseudomonas putida]GLO14515.1 quinone oxidoreductase [Pseudomonas putida]GLO35118.1 quinone oxidoreductase [Pseudomonas putida]HDS0963402.1 quinone oxidoreductase [Pseudomonas putida]HDS0992830.1 quinone oxidoreductase [Pseudomonas putida]
MATRIILTHTGTADVMQLEHVDAQPPGRGQVWLEQTIMGVNPLDVLQRKGGAPLPLPSGLGLEGAGRVTAVGEGVTNVQVGDRVAYAMGPIGAYASARLFPADRLVKLPPQLDDEAAAAVLFKGITAQYLLKTTFAVGPGTQVLLYGAAGALGQLMAPWARHLGATVIGVVSRPQSVARAQAAGCHHVLVFDAATLAGDVRELTQGQGVDVVYDCVGKVSLEASLDSLRMRGLLVSFGGSSGAPAAIEVATLNAKGSLYLTRPSLAAHTRTVDEYQQRAADVLAAVAEGIIQPRVWRRYPLADVARAHRDLEQGLSEGALVLTA